LDSADSRESLVALLAFIVLIVAAVFFIRWFHRAYRNLRPLEGSEPRFKTWWAIGGWFIPIWNLFRPKQIANDLWRSSRAPGEPANYVPALFQWWWAFFIISTLIENASFRADVSASDVDTYSTLAVVDMFTDSLNVVAGILAILVVRRTTARMDTRAAQTASA